MFSQCDRCVDSVCSKLADSFGRLASPCRNTGGMLVCLSLLFNLPAFGVTAWGLIRVNPPDLHIQIFCCIAGLIFLINILFPCYIQRRVMSKVQQAPSPAPGTLEAALETNIDEIDPDPNVTVPKKFSTYDSIKDIVLYDLLFLGYIVLQIVGLIYSFTSFKWSEGPWTISAILMIVYVFFFVVYFGLYVCALRCRKAGGDAYQRLHG
uniref:Uncharacterized protein n=1 Tax=Noctiluca scintillans TaxID=2966 RepID=A0A7S1FL26_NOCSC